MGLGQKAGTGPASLFQFEYRIAVTCRFLSTELHIKWEITPAQLSLYECMCVR